MELLALAVVSLTCVWLRAASPAGAAVTLSAVKAVAAIVPRGGVVLFNEVSVLALLSSIQRV